VDQEPGGVEVSKKPKDITETDFVTHQIVRSLERREMDEAVWPIYSHQYFTGDEHDLPFFQTPVGQGKTDEEDTNMWLAGNLPEGNRYFLKSLGVYFVPDWPQGRDRKKGIEDVLRVLSRGCVTMRIQNREYLRVGPIAALPPGFPMYWAANDERLGQLLKAGHTVAAGEKIKRLEPPRHGFDLIPFYIASTQFFEVRIRFNKPIKLNNPGRLGVILYGHIIRDLQ
jgi:hypothetical protein